MDYVIGEIYYEENLYHVSLLIDNQKYEDLKITIRRGNSVTHIPIGNNLLPVQLTLLLKENDRIDYVYGNTMKEIKLKLTPNLDKIFTYSCDFPEKDSKKKSIWSELIEEIEKCENRCLAVGLGDNIYADAEWEMSLNFPNSTLNLYSERYRQTLFNTERKRLLNLTSNLFIPDDHEIVNNLTFEVGMEMVEHVTKNIITAYESFLLQHHISRVPFLNRDWVKKYDDLMIITIERATRGIPDLNTIFNRLNTLLLEDSEGIKKLIIMTGWGCIPCPRNPFYRRIFGRHKYMSDKELYVLYDYILGLCDKYSIILVGGDLHFGSNSSVSRNGKCFGVMISSPITNKPKSDKKLAASSLNDSLINLKDIVFHNFVAKAKRCYGRIINEIPLTSQIVFKQSTPRR